MDRGTEDFAAFYERHRDPCFRAVLAGVGDRHLAEELTAEAFARAWGHWRKVAGHPAPAAWVVRTALNTHVSWWRRRRREVAWDAAAVGAGAGAGVQTSGHGPADDDATVVDLAIRTALRKLPKRQREVVVLRVFLDLDTRGTAAALGIAPGTVQAHLHRALKALRTELEETHEREEIKR
ncbi:RNA polymerase, sigma-24 subunit, ECF subfamily [Catenulispora acidiphila DSM 44928]|uniref:RNA polymerase, sigma-24 subunit, ECF subfamily n=1 Tax=Catenulispora acidiphila (strain DSM 44928 / JCM 14897 / NBRC 102108 / NRRL B-24433 / ID139908) TaxID=479433 RepID=C7Q242_CATAD|nr:SigE family RNA polymerase sigma factor [Catenulispora acidiphila]ACU77579.1 RNA polymerase, sigma-24 subunit, ECF subfamily [Catenulispora acidiphila DSM 44928]